MDQTVLVRPVESPVETPGTERRWPALLRLAGHLAWITGLGFAVELITGRFGFNPTDQGFTLGLSWRLVQGEVPHRDIVSARPLGSAMLHVLDFFLPGPLFLSSGVLTALELVVTCVALAVVLTGRPLSGWGPLLTGFAVAATLVDINTAPIMAWHTTDGLLCTAGGLWALDVGLRTGRAFPRRLGLVVLGFAVLTKQSFAPDPLIALAMLLWHPAVRRSGRGALTILLDLLCLVVAPLGYVGLVAGSGGLHDAILQFSGATAAYDQRLGAIWLGPTVPGAPSVATHADLLITLYGLAGLLVVRLTRRWLGLVGRTLDRLLTLGVLALVVRTVIDGQLANSTDWGIALFWIAVASAVLDGLTRRRLPWRPLLVLLAAAMCTLSWGADSPTELGGVLALTTMFLLVRGLAPIRWTERALLRRRGRVTAGLAGAVVGLVAVAFAGQYVLHQRDLAPYRDEPTAALTEDLGSAIPALAGIRSNPSVLDYLRQLRACVADHPADSVAVLPDNAFVYPALGLRDPFPMDWPLPEELVGNARDRMLATTAKLNRDGDYLVLFQTVGWQTLATGQPIPGSVTPDAQVAYYDGLESALERALHGQRITCGSFVGVWVPRR